MNAEPGNYGDVDTVLDANQKARYKAGFGTGATRGWLLLHELGHTAALNHVNATTQVMWPQATAKPAAYADGDREGLRRVGATQGCLGQPSQAEGAGGRTESASVAR